MRLSMRPLAAELGHQPAIAPLLESIVTNRSLIASIWLLAAAVACRTGDQSSRTSASGDPRVDSIIGRNLTRYLSRRVGGPVRVSYEYLRSGATITGIGYPKYYVWVRAEASSSGSRLEGPARVALIDSVAEVTHFFARDSATAPPAALDSVFPAPVVASIHRRYWK